jgi:hypothetical protein
VLTQGAAKLAVVHTLQRLSIISSTLRKRFVPIAHGSTLVWTVFAVFALAFQCSAPRSLYRADQCLNGALWYPVIIANLLSDFGISIMFIPTVWQLQMQTSQRLTVVSLFLVRIL